VELYALSMLTCSRHCALCAQPRTRRPGLHAFL